MSATLGIDPGLGGALCWRRGQEVLFIDMPTLQAGKANRRTYDLTACATLAAGWKLTGDVQVVMEELHVMPRNGALTAFSQGGSMMLWRTLCCVYDLPLRLVTPSVWKRALGLQGKGKDASLALARELFPGVADQLKRVKDDGRAEALLLTVWLERQGG